MERTNGSGYEIALFVQNCANFPIVEPSSLLKLLQQWSDGEGKAVVEMTSDGGGVKGRCGRVVNLCGDDFTWFGWFGDLIPDHGDVSIGFPHGLRGGFLGIAFY